MPLDLSCDDCGEQGAEPVFTAPLTSIDKRRKTRQPKWFCAACRPRHHRVSAISGRRVVSVGALHRERMSLRKGVTVSGEKES